MGRGKKLLIVGVVLVVGIGLAWPFRKTADRQNLDAVAKAPLANSFSAQNTAPAAIARTPQLPRQAMTQNQSAQGQSILAQSTPDYLPQLGSPAPHIVAKMTSMGDGLAAGKHTAPAASFDLANHPALAASFAPRQESPVTPTVPPQVVPETPRTFVSDTRRSPPTQVPSSAKANRGQARPAYMTTERDHVFDAARQRRTEVRHVVQNSDTLEKLAKLYLGDEGRALEIFDLNRDVLDNPHLLPIDAELRIPADGRKTLD